MSVSDIQPISGCGRRDDRGAAGKTESRTPATPDPGRSNLALPPADTKRWSSRRKAAVIVAMRARVITREEARERYMISDEELAGWEAAFDKNGIPGLRIAAIYSHRPSPPAKR
jgi:uncharacterized protein DUF1153